MPRKSEIKVYLPTKMVGELESLKRAGVRSKFIATAIRNHLDKMEEYDIWQTETVDVLNEAVVRIRRLEQRDREDAIMEFIKRCLQ
jgi:metal-responsive CopG/Arc/MetJ family transcriptional regulator